MAFQLGRPGMACVLKGGFNTESHPIDPFPTRLESIQFSQAQISRYPFANGLRVVLVGDVNGFDEAADTMEDGSNQNCENRVRALTNTRGNKRCSCGLPLYEVKTERKHMLRQEREFAMPVSTKELSGRRDARETGTHFLFKAGRSAYVLFFSQTSDLSGFPPPFRIPLLLSRKDASAEWAPGVRGPLYSIYFAGAIWTRVIVELPGGGQFIGPPSTQGIQTGLTDGTRGLKRLAVCA
ncbi:hypothetical protein K439DRAFT_1621019 [Ramaria rubella]|nr:hypothetical protein K439DRAFT_1621019 [Ramaria rubella]